MRISEITIIEK
ncbi:Protein of unknown function [Lactobacillus delbrueckii subsp. bulgaricus]|nr:Protein of unknown function [Lactobacillus delbrueckii subsp. bulgaricus]CDR76212.1 Protein of unknown function [Lactobacillus delbrueckii subsp. bulgaricus]